MKRSISFFALALFMSTTLSSCFLFRGGHELCPAYGELEQQDVEQVQGKALSGTEILLEEEA